MSVQAMAWAIEQRVTTDPNTKFVLICLANYADKSGKSAFPSVASLCEDTLLSESTVRRHLDKLEESGLIRRGDPAIVAAHIKRGDRRPVCYELAMERGVTQTPREATGCHGDGNGVSMTTKTGCHRDTQSVLKKTINDPGEVVKTTFEEDFKRRFGTVPRSH